MPKNSAQMAGGTRVMVLVRLIAGPAKPEVQRGTMLEG